MGTNDDSVYEQRRRKQECKESVVNQRSWKHCVQQFVDYQKEELTKCNTTVLDLRCQIAEYKQVVKEKDDELEALRKKVAELEAKGNNTKESRITELEMEVANLKREASVIRCIEVPLEESTQQELQRVWEDKELIKRDLHFQQEATSSAFKRICMEMTNLSKSIGLACDVDVSFGYPDWTGCENMNSSGNGSSIDDELDEIDMLDEVIAGDFLTGQECCSNNELSDDDRTPLYLRRRGIYSSKRARTPESLSMSEVSDSSFLYSSTTPVRSSRSQSSVRFRPALLPQPLTQAQFMPNVHHPGMSSDVAPSMVPMRPMAPSFVPLHHQGGVSVQQNGGHHGHLHGGPHRQAILPGPGPGSGCPNHHHHPQTPPNNGTPGAPYSVVQNQYHPHPHIHHQGGHVQPHPPPPNHTYNFFPSQQPQFFYPRGHQQINHHQ